MGLLIAFAGLIIGLVNTWYHGWNWLPQSGTEFTWDLIAIMVTLLGWRLHLDQQHTARDGGEGEG